MGQGWEEVRGSEGIDCVPPTYHSFLFSTVVVDSSSSGAQTMQGALKSKTNDGSEDNATCITHLKKKKAFKQI